MESRSRASPEQFVTLLKFMESHDDITRPQPGPHGRIKADKLWSELEGILNAIPGGVTRSMEKWKKVWADWKAKTKKKAKVKSGESSGTGGGPSSRQPLTTLEERVLGIMGLTALIGKAGIEERSFAALPSEINSLPVPTRNTIQIVCPSQISDPDETQATSSASTPTSPVSLPSPSRETPRDVPSPAPSPPPNTSSPPMPSATSPTASMSRGSSQRRRHHASPSPTASKTQFLRVMSELLAIKHRQLQLEADREKNLHERELERLRLESKRIEMAENQNIVLNRLAGTVDKLIEILPQLR